MTWFEARVRALGDGLQEQELVRIGLFLDEGLARLYHRPAERSI